MPAALFLTYTVSCADASCTDWLWVKSWNDSHRFEMLPISQWLVRWDLPSNVLHNGSGWRSFVLDARKHI